MTNITDEQKEVPFTGAKKTFEESLNDLTTKSEESTNKIMEDLEATLEQKRDEIISAHKEENGINNKLMTIEGAIQWKITVDTESKKTEIVASQSVSNEAAMLGLASQLIDGIINMNIEKGVEPKEMQRMRIAQFELQKLFGRCLGYVIDNRDKELLPKEEVKSE